MGRRDRLDDAGIGAALVGLAWQHEGDTLAKRLTLPTFPAAIAFVGQVAEIAEAMDHHPDIDIRWRTVVLRVSTHSAGGITQMDVEFANRVDAIGAAATTG
jgi:4a-hydroxytetrahydrobiopterin dehydratase